MTRRSSLAKGASLIMLACIAAAHLRDRAHLAKSCFVSCSFLKINNPVVESVRAGYVSARVSCVRPGALVNDLFVESRAIS